MLFLSMLHGRPHAGVMIDNEHSKKVAARSSRRPRQVSGNY
jgi:hypothetical protein